MQYRGRSEEVLKGLLARFEKGDVPAALATIFIKRDDDSPCRQWSTTNQILIALSGHDDARGYRQWEEVNRNVKKGEKATFILGPVFVKREEINKETGETVERPFLIGFKSIPVFGYDQTEGEELPGRETERTFIDSLPLIDVARSWGIKVTTYNGEGARAQGFYRADGVIGLGTEGPYTWAHELIHAADYRMKTAQESSKKNKELVAELGCCALLEMIGITPDAGFTWAYVKHYTRSDNPLPECYQIVSRAAACIALILDESDRLKAERIAA